MNGTIGSSWKVGSLMMQSALLTESEHMGGGGRTTKYCYIWHPGVIKGYFNCLICSTMEK
jgi:hypothetical protein